MVFNKRILKKEKAPKAEVTIDYPAKQETIVPGHYAVRVSVRNGEGAEIQINSANWSACRNADGYYWFDWSPQSTGKAKLIARTKDSKGKWVKSKQTICKVG